MDYNPIVNFLDKFKKILFEGEASNEIIANIITKHISVPIKASAIKVRGINIYIQGSPMLRNEILIHKQGILKDLSSLLPAKRFNDIR